MSDEFTIEYATKDGKTAYAEVLELEKPELDWKEELGPLPAPISFRKAGFVYEKEICAVGGVPDFKTETWYKKVKILGKTIRIPYPHISTRTCRVSFVAQIRILADAPNIKDDLIECSIWAAVAAAPVIIAACATGIGIAAAAPAGLEAFTQTLIQCMVKKGFKEAINVGIDLRKTCGAWH